MPLHSRLATDKTRYVTSSYILCHIIIHAISHHQTECAPAFSAGNRSKGLLVPKGGEEKKKRRKRKRRKQKKSCASAFSAWRRSTSSSNCASCGRKEAWTLLSSFCFSFTWCASVSESRSSRRRRRGVIE